MYYIEMNGEVVSWPWILLEILKVLIQNDVKLSIFLPLLPIKFLKEGNLQNTVKNDEARQKWPEYNILITVWMRYVTLTLLIK